MRQTFVIAREPVRFPRSDGNGQFLLVPFLLKEKEQ